MNHIVFFSASLRDLLREFDRNWLAKTLCAGARRLPVMRTPFCGSPLAKILDRGLLGENHMRRTPTDAALTKILAEDFGLMDREASSILTSSDGIEEAKRRLRQRNQGRNSNPPTSEAPNARNRSH